MGRAGTVFIWESLGYTYSHLGGRGKILKLILLLPAYSSLWWCLQAKMKTSPGAPVPNRDTTGIAGRASEDKRGQKAKGEERSAWGAICKITKSLSKAWSQMELRKDAEM